MPNKSLQEQRITYQRKNEALQQELQKLMEEDETLEGHLPNTPKEQPSPEQLIEIIEFLRTKLEKLEKQQYDQVADIECLAENESLRISMKMLKNHNEILRQKLQTEKQNNLMLERHCKNLEKIIDNQKKEMDSLILHSGQEPTNNKPTASNTNTSQTIQNIHHSDNIQNKILPKEQEEKT